MTDYNYQDRSIFKDAAMLVGVCGIAGAIAFTFVGIISCGDAISQAILRQLVAKQKQPSTSSHDIPTQSETKTDAPGPNAKESESEKKDAPDLNSKESEPKPQIKKQIPTSLADYVLGFIACWFLVPALLSINSASAPLLRYKVPCGWTREGYFFHDVGLWESFKYWLYIWAILSIPSLFLMLLGLLIRDLSKMLDALGSAQKDLDAQASERRSDKSLSGTPTQEVSEPFEKVEAQR